MRSVAANMNAGDERFLSMEAYNLLFGAAELLTVSVQASVSTEDNENPTAEQLKVRKAS